MKRGWRKDPRLIPWLHAAGIIGLRNPFAIWHVIEVGDLRPKYLVGWQGKGKWPASSEHYDAQFSWYDIRRFSHEFNVRRAFRDFKVEYYDVLMISDEPGSRGLEFGPGWEGILREFCDGLRELHLNGSRYYLRWGKEKFGALRLFTTRNPDPELADDEAIAKLRGIAYRRSLQTCEECGEPGRLRMGIGICQTLCDRHQHLCYPLNPELDGVVLDLDEYMNRQTDAG